MFRQRSEQGTHLASIPPNSAIQHIIPRWLKVLNSYSTGTAMYILSCLCPEDFAVVLALVRLDLSQPHQHKYLPKKDVRLKSNSYEDSISHLRACVSLLPTRTYSHFWLELTRRWLLTCPVDTEDGKEDCKPDENGNDMFCQKLRSQLIENILKID